MARNEEKSQLMLNKWVTMKQAFAGGRVSERRPFLASDCSDLGEAERWRGQIVRELTRKVSEIQNAGLGEHKLRDLNDKINKLLREKGHWQARIRQLGGPDYNAIEPKTIDADGRALPGSGGYKYFGAARDLPGVKELFQSAAPTKKRRTRADMNKHLTPDYYGFRDEALIPGLLEKEAALEAKIIESKRRAELAEREKRRANRGPDEPDTSDDDPDFEPIFLEEVARFHDAEFAAVLPKHLDEKNNPPPKPIDPILAARKRDLLAMLGEGDYDEGEPPP